MDRRYLKRNIEMNDLGKPYFHSSIVTSQMIMMTIYIHPPGKQALYYLAIDTVSSVITYHSFIFIWSYPDIL